MEHSGEQKRSPEGYVPPCGGRKQKSQTTNCLYNLGAKDGGGSGKSTNYPPQFQLPLWDMRNFGLFATNRAQKLEKRCPKCPLGMAQIQTYANPTPCHGRFMTLRSEQTKGPSPMCQALRSTQNETLMHNGYDKFLLGSLFLGCCRSPSKKFNFLLVKRKDKENPKS